MSSDSLVRLDGVRKSYRRSRFRLGPLDLDFGPGVTCLVGANGAGKSTLFRVLSGLERPDGGSVVFADGVRVGLMPQDPLIPRGARCGDYLHHIGWLYGVPREQRSQRVADVLDSVGLTDRAGDKVGELSGGMVRRLALAATLLPQPQVLLLDEPTVGLDPLQRISMRETVTGLGSDVAVVISTHLVEDVRALDGRVVVLNAGQEVFSGSVSQLAARDPGVGPGESEAERAVAALMGEQVVAG